MLYKIPEIIPLEDYVRESSLRFLTQVWRNLGSFSCLRNPPYMRRINGANYAEDGNHRCVWKMINGILTINAEEEILNESIEKVTLITAESVREREINSFFDLVKRVRNPEQYSITGQVTHKITAEDLANPNYFLRI